MRGYREVSDLLLEMKSKEKVRGGESCLIRETVYSSGYFHNIVIHPDMASRFQLNRFSIGQWNQVMNTRPIGLEHFETRGGSFFRSTVVQPGTEIEFDVKNTSRKGVVFSCVLVFRKIDFYTYDRLPSRLSAADMKREIDELEAMHGRDNG